MQDRNEDPAPHYKAACALNERRELLRKCLAALRLSEKIKILEKLRDREKAIAAARLRRETADR
jgi:hypothetical protein